MRHYFLLVLFLSSVSFSFGQTPSAEPQPSPSPSPEQRRDFGSSLKRYEKKKRKDSQDKSKGKDLDDDEVIRVKTDLVVNDVLVTNQKGNMIIGLQKEDFIVTEDGVPQTIGTFSFGDSASIPRSVVLIMDATVASGPYQKKSIEAAKTLVDKLAPQDKMAIVTADLKLRLDFTNDKILLKKTLDSLIIEWELLKEELSGSSGGLTGRVAEIRRVCGGEFCTLLAVLNEMFDGSEQQPIIVFQSNGTSVIWLKQDKDSPYPVSYSTLDRSGMRWTRHILLPEFGFREVKEAIERSRATVYSIIPGMRFLGLSKEEQLARAKIRLEELNKYYKWNKEGDMPTIIKYYQYAEAERKTAGQTAMFKVAELSGGFADFIEKPEDAENVYSNIFTVIKNRYIIGYYPTNRNRDGRRREVQIQVRNHPEYTVKGRKAYFLQ